MKGSPAVLPRAFFACAAVRVARDLIGARLLVDGAGGTIVETEAYDRADPASHSHRGPTPRNAAMFGPPGHAYVYLIYGIYHCVNVVTQAEGIASAVLLRALEPVRNVAGRTQGPGLLCRALEIDKRLDGHDLLSEDFFIAEDERAGRIAIVRRPRVGVDYAGRWARRLLRFYIRGNPYVSRK
jgi:DNA-3-methyladenine glycosylase